MKIIYSLILSLVSVSLSAQTVFWTEDFGSGCDQGDLASIYSGSNGAWTIMDSGVNEADANNWFVSASENGSAIGQCHSGCTGSTGNRTLHISQTVEITNPLTGEVYPIDGRASYAEGMAGLCMPPMLPCTVTAKRSVSPSINCTGKTNISIAFDYIHNGDGMGDNATIWYSSNGGGSWELLGNVPKSQLCSSDEAIWAAHNISLPTSSNNNANIKIGFDWVNNGDGSGHDPSVAIDNIKLSTQDATPPCCPGDFNCDGVVNVLDMIIIVNQFGCNASCTADLNNDGIIGAPDLTIFNGLYGTICP